MIDFHKTNIQVLKNKYENKINNFPIIKVKSTPVKMCLNWTWKYCLVTIWMELINKYF